LRPRSSEQKTPICPILTTSLDSLRCYPPPTASYSPNLSQNLPLPSILPL
jgi:hypothetical protein